MALTEEQRSALRRVELAALVRDLTGGEVEPATVGANAAALAGATAYVLVPDATPAALAGAVAWSLRHDGERVVLFVDDLAPDVARMAANFSHPVEVRAVQGASSAPVEPSDLPERLDPPSTPELVAQLRDAGLEVVVEDGIVRGEVLGLEVARLVVWPLETGGDGEVHLEAGVGRFDRDAVAAIHQGESPSTSLARSVAMVAAERVPGRSTHPLARLARERWLRRSLIDEPGLVGAVELAPVETTVRRDSVRDVSPAAALGTDGDGGAMVVVCSTGADLSFVPVAADTREWWAPGARLVLAVPERDRLPTLDRLAALLDQPVEVCAAPAPWEGSTDPAGDDR